MHASTCFRVRTTAVGALLALAGCATPSSSPSDIPIAAVRLSPVASSLVLGGTARLGVVLLSKTGRQLTGRSIEWETSNAAIATVSSDGLVSALSRGTVEITASSEGQSGRALVVVRYPVASVSVSFPSLVLTPGQVQTLSATALDQFGQPILDLGVTWSSSAPHLVSVHPTGLVTALGVGTATIRAVIAEGSVDIPVTVAAPVNIEGIWDWTETIGVCNDTGSYVFSQIGGALRGSSAQVGTCARSPNQPNNGEAALASGSIGPASLTFDRQNGGAVCRYTGGFDAANPTRISGTVSCALGIGTWEAVRQTPIAQLRVVPVTTELMTGATLTVTVELTNTSGQRVFFRPVTWSSDNPAVASVSQTGAVTGGAVGSAEISAAILDLRGSTPVTVRGISFTAIAAGGKGSCALAPAGETFCWGQRPVFVAAPPLTKVYVGAEIACGLTTDGSAFCWGINSTGEMGVPGVAASVAPLAVSGGLRFSMLTTGGLFFTDYYYYYTSYTVAHTCGLTLAGSAYCWGSNSWGQLGTGTTMDSPSPKAVTGGLSFTALSAGGHHTCGLTAAGAALCWGNNESGQLGRPGGSSSTPTAVSGGVEFVAIAAGTYHTCALTAAGAAYCWGENSWGQLGDQTAGVRSSVPVAVTGGHVFSSITAGERHTCALTALGQAYCWGANDFGQLGIGQAGSQAAPAAVTPGLSFATLATGSSALHTCGATTAGVLYCWGNVSHVGAGAIGSANQPVRVVGQP